MDRTMRLLVVANPGLDSKEVRDAVVRRAAEGPVHVTLVAPVAVGTGPLTVRPGPPTDEVARARLAAPSRRLERAIDMLRDAGVPAEGVLGGEPDAGGVQTTWDPASFDEVVVSCVPWLSLRTTAAACERGAAGS